MRTIERHEEEQEHHQVPISKLAVEPIQLTIGLLYSARGY